MIRNFHWQLPYSIWKRQRARTDTVDYFISSLVSFSSLLRPLITVREAYFSASQILTLAEDLQGQCHVSEVTYSYVISK